MAPCRRRCGSNGTMSALLLCLCAIVLVSSVACRDNAEVVHPVAGESQNDPTEGVPNVGRVKTPAESLPRSLSASPVADTQNAVELPRRDQQLAPIAQPTVQAVRATDSAEPARPGPQPSLVAQPALAGGPTVTSETQGRRWISNPCGGANTKRNSCFRECRDCIHWDTAPPSRAGGKHGF